MRIPLLRVALAIAVSALPLAAQTDTLAERRAQLLQQLQPGAVLRIRTGNDLLVGRLSNVSADTLFLDNHAFNLRALERIELRQRATVRGMKIGAIVGAPAGAVFGALLLWLVSAMCEYDCSDNSGSDIALGAAAFAAGGAVAGGAVGAAIGAATPRWVNLDDARLRLSRLGSTAPSHRIGSVAVTPVYAHNAAGAGGGPGVRAAFAFQTRRVSFGPEIGYYDLGEGNLQSVTHWGGISRVGAGSDRQLEPYASLGAGLFSWNMAGGGALRLGGYSAGGGLQLRSAAGKAALFGEARWQSNLTRSGNPDGNLGFYTIGLGGSLTW